MRVEGVSGKWKPGAAAAWAQLRFFAVVARRNSYSPGRISSREPCDNSSGQDWLDASSRSRLCGAGTGGRGEFQLSAFQFQLSLLNRRARRTQRVRGGTGGCGEFQLSAFQFQLSLLNRRVRRISAFCFPISAFPFEQEGAENAEGGGGTGGCGEFQLSAFQFQLSLLNRRARRTQRVGEEQEGVENFSFLLSNFSFPF